MSSDENEKSSVLDGAVLQSETPPPPVSNAGPSPPPNGGLVAWLHVVGGFMIFFNTWGFLNSFGVFQTYYEKGELFQQSSSNISWIGSIQSFVLLLSGVVAGPIYDRGYLRALLVVGTFGVVFGIMMLSICKEYWQVVLAQGVCVGLGSGCLFIPCVSVLPTYFSSRLGLAVGLASSGASLGGIIYPIVLYRLINEIGFAWAVRVTGFIALATLLVAVSVMRMRFKSPKPRAVIDPTAIRDIPYVAFVFGTLVGFMGLSILLFYVSYYPEEQGFTDTDLAFYMVAIFNAGSCFGRIVPNAMSDKLGPFNIIAPCSVISGVVILCMLTIKDAAGTIVTGLVSGFFSGVFIAMPPVCLAVLTKDKSLLGTRVGQGFGIISLGLLVGGPGAGAVLGTTPPLNWKGVWVMGGVTSLAAGFIYSGIRFYRSGPKLLAKV